MVNRAKQYITWGILLVCLPFGMLAREFRAPLLVCQSGYNFDVSEKAAWHIAADVDWYSRSSHRAFSACGVKTGELSALFFNADTFRLSHIFENCMVSQLTQHYSPFMRIMQLQPRVEYYENGMCLSANASRSVRDGKGRWGVRIKLPLRAVNTIRKDTESRRDSQTEEVVKFQKNEATAGTIGFAYRLDFLEAMPTNNLASSQVNYAAIDGSNTYINIFGGDPRDGGAAAVYSPEGYVPRGTRVGIPYTSATSAKNLPTTLEGMDDATVYAFGDGDFSKLADSASLTVASRVLNQDKKANVWVVSTHDTGGSYYGSSTATNNISGNVRDFMCTFNANTYEWLHDRGYDFQTTRQVGLGDTDLELYYDHLFGDRIVGGVSTLLRLPTACGSGADEGNYTGNPYRSHSGNGRHFEIGTGVHMDAETCSWIMVRGDVEYRFALARSEKTCGVPAGSLIKNIGSEQLADVSWHSVVANGELHFCHPHTTDITGFVGYQFYWKRADTVRFRSATVDSWLGALYSPRLGGTGEYTIDNTIALDNALASANTEQIAHRIKGGVVYHISDWLSVRAGAAITFAGKNMPKETDVYAGCQVTF